MQTKSKPNKVTLWSGQNCTWCDRAKVLLDCKNIPYEVKQIGVNATREEFFLANPGARTVPQIWFDDQLVGGFEDLKKVLA